MAAVEAFQLDPSAISALESLAQESATEKDKVIAKLHNKTGAGKEIAKPSAFVQICCRNAMEKVRAKAAKK